MDYEQFCKIALAHPEYLTRLNEETPKQHNIINIGIGRYICGDVILCEEHEEFTGLGDSCEICKYKFCSHLLNKCPSCSKMVCENDIHYCYECKEDKCPKCFGEYSDFWTKCKHCELQE